jgi:oligopeptide/dipeptide ABC transporter ATP-binding protein
MNPILELIGLTKDFTAKNGVKISAVRGINLQQAKGETIGIVGESGCGKSTLGRMILQLIRPSAGRVMFQNQDLMSLGNSELRQIRRQMQMIFQDPYAALDPRMTVGQLVEEPLLIHGERSSKVRQMRAAELLTLCGLSSELSRSYPAALSGGQRQRICIARALALSPKLVVADEPVSALDVSVQAQVINLMMQLKRNHDLSYIFISHNLAVVKYVSDRIAVMYLGRIVEMGLPEDICDNPAHPYTRLLLDAIPVPDPERTRPTEEVSSHVLEPKPRSSGCSFVGRCLLATEKCRSEPPKPVPIGAPSKQHWVECHLY